MGKTSIEWTERSVNPVRARLNGRTGHHCEKVSPGCKGCYSSVMQRRFGMPPFEVDKRRDVENFFDPLRLREVLVRRAPTKWFWCDMTDLFGDWVRFEWIAACFGVMAATPHHTHQVLTKRPDLALKFFEWVNSDGAAWGKCVLEMGKVMGPVDIPISQSTRLPEWPLPNVWFGTSAEDQKRAEERLSVLLRCPAAVHWVSAEPLLEQLSIKRLLGGSTTIHMRADVEGMLRHRAYDGMSHEDGKPMSRREAEDALFALHAKGVKYIPVGDCDDFSSETGCPGHKCPGIDWVVVGGESGPGARPMDRAWARDLRDQCADAGAAFFYKQEGRHHRCAHTKEHGAKGGHFACFPEDLQIREFPKAAAA